MPLENKVAVSSGRIEDRHILEIQRTGGNQILTGGIVAAELRLDLRPHLLSDGYGRLVDGLVRQHQRHIAVDTDHGLLHLVQTCSEILGDEIDALGHLTADKRLGIVEVFGIAEHPHIGRGIDHTDELTTQLAVRLVDNHHRHLADHLVVVDPRIEQGIDQRHDDAEDEYTLIAEHLLHLLSPDVGSIL